MTNEILLIVSLLLSFGMVIALFRFFGKAGLFAVTAIATVLANIEVAILIRAFGMEQTLGNTLFAVTFLATDILSELYGKKDANKAVGIGIATSVIFIIFSNLWVHYIPSSNDMVMPSFKVAFGNTPRILTASLIAYAISEVFDVWAYHAWWRFTEKKCGDKHKMLWLRNNGSTLISQLINTVLFNFGAFYGVYEFPVLISITFFGYVIYIVTSLLDTPFVYLARYINEKHNLQ
jgi:uncharacterized integral membrane protein (TIGR00697 family)